MEGMEAIWTIKKCSRTFPFQKRGKKASWSFFFISSYDDLREKKESWKFLVWDPWQHNFVIFNLKSRCILVILLGQETYDFES